ncbi:hypothetical protein F4678DRAFT_485014 [Xylaria arbuscula]|nr:hypothetical protein F4678DRAFT_485014 [Xylaria arbuscula]
MENQSHFDLVLWQVHETEEDCDLIFRTTNGRVFYCHLDPSHFLRSPQVTEQYFKCINLLRSGDEEQDEFYIDDVFEWFSDSFRSLIYELAPLTLTPPGNGHPTLSDYLFAPYFVCRWTRLYRASEVELVYDEPAHVLIRPPTRVVVGRNSDSTGTTYFYKRFEMSFGQRHAKKELTTLRQILEAQLPQPTEARVCRLHGVVQVEDGIVGMLFDWIDKKAVLSEGVASEGIVDTKGRWVSQIKATVEWLHACGIVWGDAKDANILIDKDENAWVIDFGGSYTLGWVDKEKAGTLEGDMQGLEKIMKILD